jgi:hypothetical protein
MAGLVGVPTPDNAVLLVCDMQERLRPLIHGFPGTMDTTKRMVRSCATSWSRSAAHDLFLLFQMKAAGVLGVPVIVTEQYVKAFGKTVPELCELAPPGVGGWVQQGGRGKGGCMCCAELPAHHHRHQQHRHPHS